MARKASRRGARRARRRAPIRSLALPSPSAADAAIELADFLEILAVHKPDGNVSIEDLVRLLRRNGSGEVLEEDEDRGNDLDAGSSVTQAVAESAFHELEARQMACGSEGLYTFTIRDGVLQVKDDPHKLIYTFLMLLAHAGLNAGPKQSFPERGLELLARHAAELYLGGPAAGARAVHFGHPRVSQPNFADALHQLFATHLRDGSTKPTGRLHQDQKDGGLDVVAWRDFADRQRGKLIAFGQCAAGRTDWESKTAELQVSSFCDTWLADHPYVAPVRMFFIPWRLANETRQVSIRKAGITFDRCRIVSLLTGLDVSVAAKCEAWSKHVIERLRG